MKPKIFIIIWAIFREGSRFLLNWFLIRKVYFYLPHVHTRLSDSNEVQILFYLISDVRDGQNLWRNRVGILDRGGADTFFEEKQWGHQFCSDEKWGTLTFLTETFFSNKKCVCVSRCVSLPVSDVVRVC